LERDKGSSFLKGKADGKFIERPDRRGERAGQKMPE